MLGTSRTLVRAAAIAVVAVVAVYLLGIISCQCGLASPLKAIGRVLPWWAVEYFLVIPFALMIGEALLVGWRNSSLAVIARWGRSVQTDAFYLALQMLLYDVLLLATTGGLFWHASELSKAYSLQLGVIENPWLQAAVVFVAADFMSYWVHRGMHASPALWEAHKVHHSATDLNLMIAFRFHPLEKIVLAFADVALFLVLGATFEVFVIAGFVNMLLGQVQHARVDWTYGPLGMILVSPAFHRFHHSRHREDFDHNFGARLVVWDRLFGTYSPRTLRPEDIGVDNNTYVERPLLGEFFRPYYVFFTRAAAVLRSSWRAPELPGRLFLRRF